MTSPLDLIERYAVKLRWIYIYRDIPPEDDLNVRRFSMDHEGLLRLLASDDKLRFHARDRLHDRGWLCFIYRVGEVTAGYSFLHVPERTEWLDSLPTYGDAARECSVYVRPEFRGRGIRTALVRAQAAEARKLGRTHWAVIERRNRASLRSSEIAGGLRARPNVLIKVAGRNVFSLLGRPFQVFAIARPTQGYHLVRRPDAAP